MELPQRIPYNPKWRSILLCGALFGFAAVFMAYEAVYNTAGLVLQGIIRLGPFGATVFYWIISALGFGFVLMSILMAIRRFVNPQVLEIGTESLFLPHGLLQRKVSLISYAEIQSLSEVRVSGQTFLHITSAGRKYTLTAALLPDKKTYIEIRDFLTSQIPDKLSRSASSERR